MVNRYQGNTGRVKQIPEPIKHDAPARLPERKKPSPNHSGDGISRSVQRILQRLSPGNLELEDVVLLLLLYLLYRESGDREFLITLGAFLLL